MDITGTIIWVGELRQGTSAATGKPWMSQGYVVENRYNGPMGEQIQRVCFNLFGEERIRNANLQQGCMASVSYGVSAREYQGKWFNDVSAWKAVNLTIQQQAAQPQGMQIPPQQAAPVQQPAQGYAPQQAAPAQGYAPQQPAQGYAPQAAYAQPAPANFPPQGQQSDLPF